MSRPLAAGPSPLAGLSPRSGPSPRAGPSPLSMGAAGASPRPFIAPSPRSVSGPSPAVRPRNLPTSRPSPAAVPSSPMAPNKRRGTMGSERDAKKLKLAPGNAWVVGQVEVMQKQYKDALVAATMICQFQADCKAIGYKSKPPRRLEVRLEAAWRNYNSTRRQIEWFIAQNHEYAADPIKFVARVRPPPLAPPPMPTPSPATIGPSSVPAHIAQPHMTMASPIPLASAGFMGSRPEPPPEVQFGEGMFPDGLDLSSIGMDELNALIGGAGEFAQPQPPMPEFPNLMNTEGDTAMTPNTSKIFETLNGGGQPEPTAQPQPEPAQPQPQLQPQLQQPQQQSPQQALQQQQSPQQALQQQQSPQKALQQPQQPQLQQPPEQNTQQPQQDQQQQQQPQQPPPPQQTPQQQQPQQSPATSPADTKGPTPPVPQPTQSTSAAQPEQGQGQAQAGPAGAAAQGQSGQGAAQPGAQPQPQPAAPEGEFNFNFDNSEMDLTNIDLAALEGFFDGGSDMGNFGFLEKEGGAASAPPAPPQPPQPQAQAQAQPQPEPQPMPDLVDEGEMPAMSNIDFDDFNFDDDSMPNVDGDEFASLFAEFK